MQITLAPDQVMLDPTLALEQKGLYGLLVALAKTEQSITISELATRAGRTRHTIRLYLSPLEAAGLVTVSVSEQDQRLLLVTVVDSVADRNQAMIRAITRRLGQTRRRIRDEGSKESIGEALMKEWLTLLIAEQVYTDNARPGFLVSPLTSERLEYDRWYPALKLAWEFQGPLHYQIGKNQPDPGQLARQKNNDMVKIGLSQREGITLVEVQAKDLRLDAMLSLIPSGIPLRALEGLAQVVNFMDEESSRYRLQAGVRG